MKLTLILIAIYASCASADYPRYAGIASIGKDVAAAAAKRFGGSSKLLSQPIEPLLEPVLLIAEPFGISRLNLTASSRRLMLRTMFIGGIDYHLARDRIYWSEMSTGGIYTVPFNARGRAAYRLELLVDRSPLEWKPRALAVDYVAEKLYVLDTRGRKVHVFDLDGENHSVIFDGYLDEPMDITLDPEEGVMFIADGMRIIRVNMDGTDPRAIVAHPRYNIKSVTLDQANKRVYWSDNTYHRIKSANYDGTNLTVVLKNEQGMGFSLLGPANLAFYQGLLYFHDDMWRRIANVQVDPETGHADEYSYRLVYEGVTVKSMRLVRPIRQDAQALVNPCARNNGDCPGMCLISAKKRADGPVSHSCV